jgi:hypothetical protein
MSKILIKFAFFSLSLSLLAVAALAQPGVGRGGREFGGHPPPPPTDGKKEFEPGQRPERGGSSFRFLSSEMRFGGKNVKGAPFSAISEIVMTRTLGNGSKIENKSTATIARDNEGRTRREQSLSAIGGFAASGEAPKLAFITDPVAGKSYVLNLTKKTFDQRNSHQSGEPPMKPAPPKSSQAKTESLGSRNIEGILAEGTRSTISIPIGQIGNNQPLEIVTERWYSTELQEVVLSKHSDPLQGDHSYRLTNIVRGEPSNTLFQPPTDFTAQEGRGFGGSPRSKEHGKGEWKKPNEKE